MIDCLEYSDLLAKLEARSSFLRQEIVQLKRKQQLADAEFSILNRVHVVLGEMETALRGKFTSYIEDNVSYGLSLVFDGPYKFQIHYKTRASAPVVEFSLKSGEIETGIYEAEGGGIINVVSFLLRIILMVYSKPPLRRICFLDETFSMVSRKFRPNVAVLLKELSDKLGIVFVFISHQDVFQDVADRIYRVEKNGSTSTITMIRESRSEVTA